MIVWLRLTERAEPNRDGLAWLGTEDREFNLGPREEKQFLAGAEMANMAGSLMGVKGEVRLTWGPKINPMRRAAWIGSRSIQGVILRGRLRWGAATQSSLRPRARSRLMSGKPGQTIAGSVSTAPGPPLSRSLQFVGSTCQSWITRDKGTAGLQSYHHMWALDPSFFGHLGDIVYYDKNSSGGDVDARTPELARFHWNRWFGCSDVVDFHR